MPAEISGAHIYKFEPSRPCGWRNLVSPMIMVSVPLKLIQGHCNSQEFEILNDYVATFTFKIGRSEIGTCTLAYSALCFT